MAAPKKKTYARVKSKRANPKVKAMKKKVTRNPNARGRRPISGAKVIQAFEDLQAVTGAQSAFATERGVGM